MVVGSIGFEYSHLGVVTEHLYISEVKLPPSSSVAETILKFCTLCVLIFSVISMLSFICGHLGVSRWSSLSPFFCLHILFLCDKFIYLLSENAPEGHSGVRYNVMELPISLPHQKPPPDKPNPKQGVGESVASFYINY